MPCCCCCSVLFSSPGGMNPVLLALTSCCSVFLFPILLCLLSLSCACACLYLPFACHCGWWESFLFSSLLKCKAVKNVTENRNLSVRFTNTQRNTTQHNRPTRSDPKTPPSPVLMIDATVTLATHISYERPSVTKEKTRKQCENECKHEKQP